jgi:NhaP-type Na+/H+ or K+/H+ antiporter
VDPYIPLLCIFGAIVLMTAWVPMLLKELPLSLPIVCIALGVAAFALPGVLPGVAPHPQNNLKITERLTELVVIVALLGAGLKLDKPLTWASAPVTWRLLVVAMPLTIGMLALLGHWLLGVGFAAALLLAASLAPTDPVLASDVQVGPPRQGKEDEVRYSLTAEAGLNDGLAFPFVHLAIALALLQPGQDWAWAWLTVSVFWKITSGVVLGWMIGRGLGWLTFRLPNRAKLSRTGDGFVALGITALAYGLTEMAQGYGFLAVFVAALAFRSVERQHEYHEKLHDYVEQLERLLMMVLLVLFGGAISEAGLFEQVDWRAVVFALLAIFVVRPAAGWISLIGLDRPWRTRAIISFFGIRGLGTGYYLAYGLAHGSFDDPLLLWSTAGVVVLISVVLHGVTVTPAMRLLERRQ